MRRRPPPRRRRSRSGFRGQGPRQQSSARRRSNRWSRPRAHLRPSRSYNDLVLGHDAGPCSRASPLAPYRATGRHRPCSHSAMAPGVEPVQRRLKRLDRLLEAGRRNGPWRPWSGTAGRGPNVTGETTIPLETSWFNRRTVRHAVRISREPRWGNAPPRTAVAHGRIDRLELWGAGWSRKEIRSRRPDGSRHRGKYSGLRGCSATSVIIRRPGLGISVGTRLSCMLKFVTYQFIACR